MYFHPERKPKEGNLEKLEILENLEKSENLENLENQKILVVFHRRENLESWRIFGEDIKNFQNLEKYREFGTFVTSEGNFFENVGKSGKYGEISIFEN